MIQNESDRLGRIDGINRAVTLVTGGLIMNEVNDLFIYLYERGDWNEK